MTTFKTSFPYENLYRTKREDIFKVLLLKDWPRLRDIFRQHWPLAIYPYYVIQSFILWRERKKDVQVRILCPRERLEDGTMALIHTTKSLTTIYFFTLEPSCSRLHSCISQTRLIDWSSGPYIHSVHQKQWDAVNAALRKIGLNTEYHIKSTYHWLAKEDAIKFDIRCPGDVYIAPLEERDVKTINDVWPHKFSGSELFIQDLLDVHGGLGIFSKEDRSLRCWIIKNQHLALGMLQTLNEHKRKGYARLLIMAMSKKMASEGNDIHTMIVRTNAVSLNLFKSVGFRKIDNLMFEKVKPIMSHV